MSNYLPNGQKKNRIFRKREQELIHGIRHGLAKEKLEVLAEKLRQAKLNVFKDRFDPSEGRRMRASDEKTVERWMTATVEELIAEYRRVSAN